jgi:hypothetical protein
VLQRRLHGGRISMCPDDRRQRFSHRHSTLSDVIGEADEHGLRRTA